MRQLAQHYAEFQRAYPEDPLLIVFDVDGVVVDPRHALRDRLLEYDRVHDTDHFDGLEAADLDVGGNHVEGLLAERDLFPVVRRDVLDWYLDGPREPVRTALRPLPESSVSSGGSSSSGLPSSGSTPPDPSGFGSRRSGR